MKKRILVFVSYYLPGHKSGGPAKTLANLIDATGDSYDFSLVTRDRDLGDSSPYGNIQPNRWNQVGQARVRYIAPGLRGWFQIARILAAKEHDAVYLNSFFAIQFSLFPVLLARLTSCKTILGPRGQFSKGAMELKSTKKRLFARLYSALGLHKRITWQASTEYELDDIVEVFGSNIDVAIAANIASRTYASVLTAKQAKRLRMVFISRISPKKHLDYALERLKDVIIPVSFDVYGPIEDPQHWSRCEAIIDQLPPNVEVMAKGAMLPNAVVDTLAGYDLFFFPTRGENYGHVITEALCAGLPLLLSDTTPWRNLEAQQLGWDLPLAEPDKFVQRIHEVHDMKQEAHSKLRRHILSWRKPGLTIRKRVTPTGECSKACSKIEVTNLAKSTNHQSGPVLITGGTGSFGKTMAQHLLDQGVDEIRIFSRDEAKQEEMRLSFDRSELKFYIGDVRDKQSVAKAMRGVAFVFHAAALKQVPSCEFFPLEAVKTNILGSQNVIESAVDADVGSVVCLSTDKAVMPVNAMGMTKAIMEKVAQAAGRQLNEGETTVSCVRYGNVMCSRGSVIPLFMKQIKSGMPLTITEPTMTRFMLSLTDATELVSFAFANASQGDIFVKKAPACTVQLLAETLLDIFEAKNEIRTIGMRHGEKIYETLASTEELRRSQDMGDYFRINLDGRDLNYNKYFSEGDVEEISAEGYHSHNTEQLDKGQLRSLLLTLPEIREELEK